MGHPKNYNIFEFGGGTGVLARDILSRMVEKHSDLVDPNKGNLTYILGERAAGLRK